MVPHKSVISRLDGTACIELHKRNCPKAKDSFRTVVYFTSFVELIDFYFIQCHCTGHFALIMRTIAINTITYFRSACKFYFHLYSFLCRELYFFIESFEGVSLMSMVNPFRPLSRIYCLRRKHTPQLCLPVIYCRLHYKAYQI